LEVLALLIAVASVYIVWKNILDEFGIISLTMGVLAVAFALWVKPTKQRELPPPKEVMAS